MTSLLLSIFVSASIDASQMMVGDQTQLHLEASNVTNEVVEFPRYDKTLIDNVEIISQGKIDTLPQKDGTKTLRQNLTITSFEDELYYLDSLPFVVNGDTFYTTNPLTINIIEPNLDTIPSNVITDIKGIENIKDIRTVPIWWWGILRWVVLGLGILLTLALIDWAVYYFYYRRKYAPNRPIPLRPAEEVALEKLDKIKEEKIWQHGREKEYHTDLTDVLREYIARRYDIRSQEKTSNETLQQLRPYFKEQKELFNELCKMLNLADMVKFAKWRTTPLENESSLETAYKFVNETTQPESTTDKQNQ